MQHSGERKERPTTTSLRRNRIGYEAVHFNKPTSERDAKQTQTAPQRQGLDRLGSQKASDSRPEGALQDAL